MRLEEWVQRHACDVGIYLAPQNDCTVNVFSFLKERGFSCEGFIDSFKQGSSIIHPNELPNESTVLIYSPNYWRDIISSTENSHHFLLIEKHHDLHIVSIDDFDGEFPVMNFNSLISQKHFWENHMRNYLDNGGDINEYGFSWGDPEDANDELGNYESISQELLAEICPNDHVVELGALSGKWTKYLLNANKVTCVDINELSEKIIRERYQSQNNKIEFYLSQGNELHGFGDNSVDYLFCIDTLVRSSESIIVDYINEILRVLKNGGKALIHLPASGIEQCAARGFTMLDIDKLKLNRLGDFQDCKIDRESIKHGVLLRLTK